MIYELEKYFFILVVEKMDVGLYVTNCFFSELFVDRLSENFIRIFTILRANEGKMIIPKILSIKTR